MNASNSQSSDPGDPPVAKKLQLAIEAFLQVPNKQIYLKKYCHLSSSKNSLSLSRQEKREF